MADTADSLASLWHSLPHAWTHDTRDPSFSFELQNGQVWNFYAMSFTAWNELLLVSIVERRQSFFSRNLSHYFLFFSAFMLT